MNIIDNIRNIISDWYKYMDTTFPPCVDKEKYLQLKYSVREDEYKFTRQYNIDKQLIMNLSLREFLDKPEEEQITSINEYLEDKLYLQIKRGEYEHTQRHNRNSRRIYEKQTGE